VAAGEEGEEEEDVVVIMRARDDLEEESAKAMAPADLARGVAAEALAKSSCSVFILWTQFSVG
jgi:hypothetical protein